MRPAQTAQEEDACSCRFPEEEEGEGGLWAGSGKRWGSRGGSEEECQTRRLTFPIENTSCVIPRRTPYKFFLNANELAFKNVPLLTEEK